MIESAPFLSPFVKRLGERLADKVMDSSRSDQSLPKTKCIGSEIEDIEVLRKENEELKTYVFLVLSLLQEKISVSARKGGNDETQV